MPSYRRLTDKTLKKYQDIIDAGGELTSRQKSALAGHELITDSAFVESMLRPDLAIEAKVKRRKELEARVEAQAPGVTIFVDAGDMGRRRRQNTIGE